MMASGQNPNASRMLACQLWPAADKPPHAPYSAMCQKQTNGSAAKPRVDDACCKADCHRRVSAGTGTTSVFAPSLKTT
jgi:hypothetical protein